MLSRNRFYGDLVIILRIPAVLSEEYFGNYAIKGFPRPKPELSDKKGYQDFINTYHMHQFTNKLRMVINV
jgi:hypothetical protein